MRISALLAYRGDRFTFLSFIIYVKTTLLASGAGLERCAFNFEPPSSSVTKLDFDA
jgi:hypothetical protein